MTAIRLATAFAGFALAATLAPAHPLDGSTATEMRRVTGILLASTSMEDATATTDTTCGALVVPSLVAPLHGHYFNFRLAEH